MYVTPKMIKSAATILLANSSDIHKIHSTNLQNAENLAYYNEAYRDSVEYLNHIVKRHYTDRDVAMTLSEATKTMIAYVTNERNRSLLDCCERDDAIGTAFYYGDILHFLHCI